MRFVIFIAFMTGLNSLIIPQYLKATDEKIAQGSPILEAPSSLQQPPAPELKQDNSSLAIARFLAGFPQEGVCADFEKFSRWQNYRSTFNLRWIMVEKARITPMIQWREAALGKITLPVFYPMGGPDVFNVLTFFPDSPEYILVGLERIGNIVTLENLKKEEVTNRIITQLEQGMDSLFQRSFFITKDMSRDFYERGVLPTMLALIARLGYDVLDIKFVSYTPKGKIIENSDASTKQGVEITFCKPGSENIQKLYYFRKNLHNSAITPFAQFIEARGPFAVMFKSSSYTPHQVGFSHLVDLVRKCGELVLQDDSGIPYDYLKEHWDVALYGTYTKPYGESFQAYGQPDLACMYATDSSIQPLNFRIGYGYGKVPSCIQIARKKVAGKTAEPSAKKEDYYQLSTPLSTSSTGAQ